MIRTSSATLFAFAVLICRSLQLFGASPPRTDIYGDPLPEGVRVRMGTMQLRHAGAQATFSADGRTLISCGSRDGLVRHWDVASGRLVRQMYLCKTPREKKELMGVTLGGRCAAMRMQDVVILRDVASGDERGRLTLKSEPEVREAIPSADGNFCLIGRDAGKGRMAVELWDVARRNQIRSGKYECVVGLHAIFSPDGKRVALRIDYPHVRLWNTTTGKELRTSGTTYSHMAFSPDGKTFAVSSSNAPIRLLDTATLKEQARLKRPKDHKRTVDHLEYSANGQLLAGVGEDGIVVWDVAALTLKHQFPERRAHKLTFAPDGKTLACWGGTLGSEIRLYDVAAGKQLHARREHAKYVDALAVSPDGKTVVSGGMDDLDLFLWDTTTGRLLRRLKGEDWIRECMFSPDGKQIVSSNDSGTIQVWDVARGAEVRRIEIEGASYKTYLQFSADGKCLNTIHINSALPSRLTVWDLTTGKQLSQRPYQVDIHSQEQANGTSTMWIEEHAAFSPDGQSVIGKKDQRLIIEDVKSGRVLALLPENVGKPVKFSRVGKAVTFSPDGQLIVATALKPSKDPFDPPMTVGIRLIETATGQEVISIQTGEEEFLDFSGDGRLLASIDKEGIHIWNVATGDEFFRRPWPKGIRSRADESPATTFAFLPDGRGVAAGMNDGAILIWDVPALREPAPSSKHETPELLWTALAGEPRKAHRAIYALAAAPEATLSFFAAHLKPATDIDANLVAKWLADLDSERFNVRQAAQLELTQHRDDIEPALRRFLENKPTLEARKRIEAVLAAPRPVPPAATLRMLRAIRVLEQIGTKEAREQLRKLAGGAAAVRQTREAEAALERRARRSP